MQQPAHVGMTWVLHTRSMEFFHGYLGPSGDVVLYSKDLVNLVWITDAEATVLCVIKSVVGGGAPPLLSNSSVSKLAGDLPD